MHQDHFQKSTCEQLVTAPFLLWNSLVQQRERLALVVPPRVPVLVPALAQVPQQELELAAELGLAQEPQRVLLAQARVHQHCRLQLQSRCQQEQCHLLQHESQ